MSVSSSAGQGTQRPVSSKQKLQFGGDVTILAPMVRLSTLPLRLLAIRHGADIVFSEELIDRKLSSCTRIVNERLGTVDFVTGDEGKGTQRPRIFRVAREEEGRLVAQIGTASAVAAWKAAEVVCRDVDGIDVVRSYSAHPCSSSSLPLTESDPKLQPLT